MILGIGPFPRMEVIGAAVATVSAQFIVMMVMIAGVWKAPGNENILVGIRLFSPSERRYYKGIFRIGLPTAIQGTVYCGISMILTRMVRARQLVARTGNRLPHQVQNFQQSVVAGRVILTLWTDVMCRILRCLLMIWLI